MLRLVLITSLLVAARGKLVPARKLLAGEKIDGGEDAKIEEVPYQAGLLREDRILCGGSILSETVVVTAAHCAIPIKENIKEWKVLVGTNTIPTKPTQQRDNQVQIVDINKVVIHPDYVFVNYDAALLFLSSPLKLGPTASPVALPDQGQEIDDDIPVLVSGWGLLKENGNFTEVLQKVTIPIVKQKICEKIYTEKPWIITPQMMCTGLLGVGGKGHCKGDSGSPVVVEGTLVGIVNWSYGCARPEYPGVSCRVAAISDWIKNQLSDT